MSKTKKEKKIFVLDTSVIIYEHNSILNFDEHDIGIPITVLEELDNFKKGNDTKNFEAREFIRLIDKLAKGQMLHHWNPLNGKTKGTFKVLMDTGGNGSSMPIRFLMKTRPITAFSTRHFPCKRKKKTEGSSWFQKMLT